MKTKIKILMITVLLLIISGFGAMKAKGQCTNTFQYPYAPFPAPTYVPYVITIYQYQGDYNQMTGVVAGSNFTSTASIAGTYITVRFGTYNGTVVATGTTPLTWTATAGSGRYFIHYNTNSSCGTDNNEMTTTITCNSCCTTPPTNDNCSGSTPVTLACGVPQTVTGTGACSTPQLDPEVKDTWVSFTIPPGQSMNITLDLCGSASIHNTVYRNIFTDCTFDPGTYYDRTSRNWSACGDGNPTLYWSGLSPGTYYYPIYIDDITGETDYTVHILGTCCTTENIPYTQDFESAVVPIIPSCTSQQNVGEGNDWITYDYPGSGFTTMTLVYEYDRWDSANTWFYTPGLNLIGGTSYRITFRYGNAGGEDWPEKLKVAYGTRNISTAMTTTLLDFPNITNDTPLNASYDFTPATTGVYYIGFNAYSAADMYELYVDDILIDIAPPLPIQLLSFDGNCTNDIVTLTWATATEVNNDYFTIEKSTDMKNWKFVKQISGAGNSNQRLDYNTTDEATGDMYYRLKQTDFDGKFEIFSPISVNCSSSSKSYSTVSIHPNPTSGMLYIQTSGSEISGIQIFEDNGKTIYTGKEAAINMANFAPGLYYIKIITTSGDMFFRKIIKE